MIRILSSLSFLAIVFLVSRYFFEPTYMYYEVWWLDIPMHILGGMGVGSFVYSVLTYKGIKVSYTKMIVAFLVIAFVWEVYEYITDKNIYETTSDYLDTVKDTIDGLIGVTIAYFFIRKA